MYHEFEFVRIRKSYMDENLIKDLKYCVELLNRGEEGVTCILNRIIFRLEDNERIEPDSPTLKKLKEELENDIKELIENRENNLCSCQLPVIKTNSSDEGTSYYSCETCNKPVPDSFIGMVGKYD